MNRNPIPIVLPCHRVIGSNGSLTGYGGGLDVKEQLLRLEGALAFPLLYEGGRAPGRSALPNTIVDHREPTGMGTRGGTVAGRARATIDYKS